MAKNQESGLPDRKHLFCLEYLKHLNGTKAALAAGYAPNSANEQAAMMLAEPEIQKYINSKKKIRADKLEISADMVLREYAKIAFIDIRKYYHPSGELKLPHELEDEAAASLSGIEIDELWEYDPLLEKKVPVGQTKKIKMLSKLHALDSISKHIGFFEKDNAQQNKVLVWNEEKTYNVDKPINNDIDS